MAALDLKANTDRFIVGLLVLAAALAAALFLWPTEEGGGGADSTAPVASGLGSCKGKDRVMVPAQKLTASLVPIQTVKRDGAVQLDPPPDPDEVGWWDASAKPGHLGGQSVITGHTVHDGAGALNNIGQVKKGQRIKVCHKGELSVFEATSIQTISKEDVARRAEALFGQQRDDARLVLLTCTDWVGPGNYRSNLFVFGKPLRTEPA